MTEGGIFLADVALVAGAGLLALAAGVSGSGRLAAGLYGIATGATFVVLPALEWDVARTDNAFLGLYFVALLAVLLGVVLTGRAVFGGRAQLRGRGVAAALGAAAVASGLALLLLAVRGPDAWRTGSGQFGLDVVAACVALGAAAYFGADRLARGRARRVD